MLWFCHTKLPGFRNCKKLQLQTGYDKQKYVPFACGVGGSYMLTETQQKNYQFSDPFDIIDLKNNETIENSQTNFIFVGVMTAKNFLEGRATAVYHTWGKQVPGKIAFFSSEKSYSESRFSMLRKVYN